MESPIYSKDGFLFFKEHKKIDSILGDRLIFDQKRESQSIKYIKNKNIKSITVNPSYSEVQNLDFLNEITEIEGFYLLQDGLDLTVINELKKLRVLRFDKTTTTIDFRNFPNLEVLGTTFNNKHFIGLESCNKLFWLWLDNFKNENLKYLESLTHLQYLNLYKTTLNNLDGIEKMTALKEIVIYSAPKLKSLKGLSKSNQELESIDIYSAKNLTDYLPLQMVEKIKRIRFAKTGDASSLAFLKNMTELEQTILGMKVLDGNIDFLTN